MSGIHSPVVHSMTGYASTSGRVLDGDTEIATWTLAIKSVNHRFHDLHLRTPAGTDALEMELRRRLKQRILRGHLEVTLTFDRASKQNTVSYDRDLVAQFVTAFRAAQAEHGLTQEPDLNSILRLPGVFAGQGNAAGHRHDIPAEALQSSVLAQLDTLLDQLDQMRATEGAGLAAVLNEALDLLEQGAKSAAQLRAQVQQAYYERLRARVQDLLGPGIDDARLLQEAVLLADRSDVEEEIARLLIHIGHFRALLSAGGEVGKKLDFLLQEMNREANTLLSKSAGIPEQGARITELGLDMKSAIEKIREQVQNLE
jgi:uncharacterized protein (TIGR00255 family)